MLAIPNQYLSRIKRVVKFVKNCAKGNSDEINKEDVVSSGNLRKSLFKKLVRYVIPRGHGVKTKFVECFSSFKIANWVRLFEKNHFAVKEIQPLLLYGPSGWPIIPTMKAGNRQNLCSSVLFLMEKSNSGHRAD